MGQSTSNPSELKQPSPQQNETAVQSACPVDHKSREAWLRAAQQSPQAPRTNTLPSKQVDDAQPATSAPKQQPSTAKIANSRLSTQREVSSIPRAFAPPHTVSSPSSEPQSSSTTAPPPSASSSSPNKQTAAPQTSATGTWIYPSEEMFFKAMRRKNYNPRAADMSSVVPIHNAVNERTWQEILQWEQAADPSSFLRCGGPKLVSFQGDSTKLTPRARWNGLIGYERPFDRHDWVVDRCGTRVEYVIDFYAGRQPRSSEAGAKPGPSFYLDVRPKLSSWEGWRMRIGRVVGLSWPTGEDKPKK